MGVPEKFDCDKVARLAAEIALVQDECARLDEEARVARGQAVGAHVALNSLRSELTRAVYGQLDNKIIQQRGQGDV